MTAPAPHRRHCASFRRSRRCCGISRGSLGDPTRLGTGFLPLRYAADVAVASDEKVEQIAHASTAAPVAEEVTKEPISTTTVSEKPAATASQPAELMIQVPDIGSDDKVEVIEIIVTYI